MVNKLLYRSRQRGFLELDLLVGLWAEQELPRMPLPMLQAYSVVLDQVHVRVCVWCASAHGAQEAHAACVAACRHPPGVTRGRSLCTQHRSPKL
jgi:succinate dehydrogenase flavin-adding protein (antitoxin of CptAB toxin-antitoxin module)